jgi:hypothetical protein
MKKWEEAKMAAIIRGSVNSYGVVDYGVLTGIIIKRRADPQKRKKKKHLFRIDYSKLNRIKK